jgi:O-antigen/teichoic acid export membrane protein
MIKKLIMLASGNFASPLIMLAITPIVTRLYSIEVIGIYHWVLSCSFFYGIFFTLQIHHSLISERRNIALDIKFNSMLWITFYCFLILTSLSLAIAYFARLEFDQIVFSCLMAFFNSLSLVVSTYLARLNAISLLSKVIVVRAITLSFFTITFSFYPEVISLVIASILSEISIMLFFYGNIGFKYKRFLKSRLAIRKELKNNIKNILYLLPSQILTNLVNIIVLTILKYISLYSLGFYALLFRVVASPLYAVGNAFKSIFYIQLIKSTNKFKFINFFVIFISFSGVCISFIYYLIEVPFLEHVLGKQFVGIDYYFPFFFLWVVSSIVNIFPTEVFKHAGNQKLILRAEVLSFLLKIPCIIFSLLYENLIDILVFYPLSFYIINLFLLVYYYKNLNYVLKSV